MMSTAPVLSKQEGGKTRFVLTASVAAMLGAGTAAAETMTIGVSVRSWDQGRFTDVLVPVVKAAAARAGYEIVLLNAEDNVDQQATDVAALVAQGVEGIVVGLVNSDAGPVVGSAAAENGTPLVYMNVAPINVDDLPPMQVYVGPDEYQVGQAQALAVCEALGAGGNVGLLIGDLLHPAAAARSAAVQDTMRTPACDGVELTYKETAQWNREFAAEVTSDWLAFGRGLDAVIANNDPMGLGAADAVEMTGLEPGSIFITSIDGQPDALEAVRTGALALTFLQDVDEQGQEIFAALARIISGAEYDSQVLLPLTPVSAQNVQPLLDG